MEMATYILTIFKHYLKIVLSWGFHNPIPMENGLRFSVQGFKHKGKVEVLYDKAQDLFSVRVLNPDGSTKEEQDGIYLDRLVDCIDRLVEYCPDYEERVRETYKFKQI